MCRNHRGFIEATVACSKLGAERAVSEHGVRGAADRGRDAARGPGRADLRRGVRRARQRGRRGRKRFVAWHEPGERAASSRSLLGRADRGRRRRPNWSRRMRRAASVILTSGTTGTPKGAARKQPDSLEPAAALFSKIPLKARETTMIAAPMFHSWGFAHFTLGLPLASTLVLRSKFDPEDTLRAVAQHRASALAVVPVMLQRILELPRRRSRGTTRSSLKVIARQRLGAAGRAGDQGDGRVRGRRSTTCTARRRWRGRRSPRRRTCARRPAPRAGRRWARS